MRLDLLYRLEVAEIHVPALRECRDDIARLARYFLEHLVAEYGASTSGFSGAALERLSSHDWPGNIRELRNVVESSLIRASGSEIEIGDLLPRLQRGDPRSNRCISSEQCERLRVTEALRLEHGNRSKAAERLRCSRTTLYRKLARYHMVVPETETPGTA